MGFTTAVGWSKSRYWSCNTLLGSQLSRKLMLIGLWDDLKPDFNEKRFRTQVINMPEGFLSSPDMSPQSRLESSRAKGASQIEIPARLEDMDSNFPDVYLRFLIQLQDQQISASTGGYSFLKPAQSQPQLSDRKHRQPGTKSNPSYRR